MKILFKKNQNRNFLVLFFLIFTSCVAGTFGSATIEKHLQSVIGRKYDPSIGWGEGWNKIYEDEKNIELEFKHQNGCSYSIQIRKDSSTVEGWRFTSPRDKCENMYAPTV